MGASSVLPMMLLCILYTHPASSSGTGSHTGKTLFHDKTFRMNFTDKLIYAYTTEFEAIWNDKDSGAKDDVSIWRPMAFQAGFYPVGDTAVSNHAPPPNAAIIVKDDGSGMVTPPSSFRVIWKDTGSGAAKDVTIYEMIPPSGYACLGNVAVGDYTQLPNANAYRCVRSDLIQTGFLFPIWNDRGSGAAADVGLWRVENDPAHPGGLTSESFLSVSNYDRPSDTPYILKSDKITLPSGDSGDIALVLYQTQEMVNIWDDTGSGAARDVSFWKADHCCSLGHIAVDNYNRPSGVFAKEIKAGTLVKPTSFTQVWTDRGSGAKRDGAIWRPVCPPGSVALGYAATGNYAPPSADDFRCVKTKYVTAAQWTWVWNDRGSGARDDVSIWKAYPINAEGQTVNAMSGIRKHGDMDIPAYVLKSKHVLVHNRKPIKKVFLYDINYNFNDKKVLRREPLELSARTKVQNCAAPEDSPPVYAERQLSFTIETESSWSFESSVEIGATVEVSAGIPGLGDASVSTSVSTTFTAGSGGRRTDSRADTINAKLEARPKYSVEYLVTGTRYTANIPWTGNMTTVFEDDTMNVEHVKGEYIGVQVAEVIVSADAPIRCG